MSRNSKLASVVDQAMAPTPWCGRQIAPGDRAAKPTGAVQTSIAKEGTDMSIQPRHSLLRTRTVCAAFLVFAAIAAIPRVAAAGSVPVCHRPPGNPANMHVINVAESALPAHLMHGDVPGPDCLCSATAGTSCGAQQAPCCAGLKCVADITGAFTCQEGTSTNPLPPGNACTDSTQCDALNPCASVGTNDSICGG